MEKKEKAMAALTQLSRAVFLMLDVFLSAVKQKHTNHMNPQKPPMMASPRHMANFTYAHTNTTHIHANTSLNKYMPDSVTDFE